MAVFDMASEADQLTVQAGNADKGDIGADHYLGLSHDIIGKVMQPNFCSRFVARFIVSDCLPEVAENRRFFVCADLG